MSGGAFDSPAETAASLASTLADMREAVADADAVDAAVVGRLEALADELRASRQLLRDVDYAAAGDITFDDISLDVPRQSFADWTYGDPCPNCGSAEGYTERRVCYGQKTVVDGQPTTFQQEHVGQALEVRCQDCEGLLLERPKDQAGR